MATFRRAPALEVSAWLNVEAPVALESLLGRVVLLHFFQMRCAGCHEVATPQAQRVHDLFSREDLAVIGVHCVFENDDAQSPELLRGYIRDQRLTFPVAIDTPGDRIPLTMKTFNVDGTPTLVLLDRRGRIRMKRLGHVPDLELGAAIGALLAEPAN